MNDKNIQNVTDSIRDTLCFQFQISWQILEMHLSELEDEEYLWRPALKGLHIVNETGAWHPDWPESEEYDIGPASVAWLTWHILFWWSMVLNHSFGKGDLTREKVDCPGNIKETRERIRYLRDTWETTLAELSENELFSRDRTKWPFADKPFYELAAWLNLELMKNAAEIGYCRFLYGAQKK